MLTLSRTSLCSTAPAVAASLSFLSSSSLTFSSSLLSRHAAATRFVPSYALTSVSAQQYVRAEARASMSTASQAVSKLRAHSVIVKLMQNIGGKKEVEQYLKYYSSLDSGKFAVVKVGGGIIIEELDTLASSLAFLAEVGLLPVVIHGAGPQLNDELRSRGIESDYIGGMRITTPEILGVARDVFRKANTRLVQALEDHGARARPIVSGVFAAEFLNQKDFQFVGQITSVDVSAVQEALAHGTIPVLTCMGESASGQILNINADVAAQELAKKLKPTKVIYLSSNGGLHDDKGQLMSVIDLETDFERLMVQPWFKHGNRLKLREIKTLLDEMPPSSSVSITSAANLPKELFTHKGSGTLVKRSEKVSVFTSLDEVDIAKLTALIESSFGGRLDPSYLPSLRPHIHRIYLTESYRSVALITKDASDPNAVPYLDKFAVAVQSQSEGSGQALWNVIRKDIPKMFWRSRIDNPINPWYFERAQGSQHFDNKWTVFWYGIESFDEVKRCYELATRLPSTIDRSGASATTGTSAGGSKRSYSTFSARSLSSSSSSVSSAMGAHLSKRAFSSASSSSSAKRVSKVGLIGARGHTGVELIKLIGQHPQLTISVASSRALKGQTIGSVVPGLNANAPFASVAFVDLAPADLPKQDVDVWVLALPNDLAKPYVQALDAAQSRAKIVDLSADYRFDPSWTYGLPERHGARERIAAATRVANPGCYATGTQCSLLPLDKFIDPSYAPAVFGVSGYSGAGTTPSRKNDVNELRDNLMPYSLVNHMHEREVSHQLRPFLPSGVRFMPHVAPWFRGISLTIAVQLNAATHRREDIIEAFKTYYKNEPLVKVTDAIPEVRDNVGQHDVRVGGFIHDAKTSRLVMTTTLDNLLKGAATQCLQNINLVLGYPETTGILP